MDIHTHHFRTVRRTNTADRYYHIARCECGASLIEEAAGCREHEWVVRNHKATCHDESYVWTCAACGARLSETLPRNYVSEEFLQFANPTECAACQRLVELHHPSHGVTR